MNTVDWLYQEQPQHPEHPSFGYWDCVWLEGRLRDAGLPPRPDKADVVRLLDELKC